MRFHVVGLPHTKTTKEYCGCAYTQKVLNFCKMMTSLGHEVYHYGAEGSYDVDAYQINIISDKEQLEWFGKTDFTKNFTAEFKAELPYWKTMNSRAAAAIVKRYGSHDAVCLIGGWCQKQIADELPKDVLTVEYGVGYYGTFSRFRVFESYTHQSAFYGTQSKDPDVQLYDCVIPNYYDPEDFPIGTYRGDYLLYVGRIIQRKGIGIAVEVARRTKHRLIVAGQGIASETPTDYVTQDNQLLPKDIVEYVGYADVPKRAELMGQAKALIAPTTYLEPFGGVAVEAQLCGTPAITTDFGGFTETVRHGFSGYRCHTLSQFMQAVGRLDELHPAAVIRKRAVEKYSIDTVRHMYNEYFQMLDTLWTDGWYHMSTREQLNWLSK